MNMPLTPEELHNKLDILTRHINTLEREWDRLDNEGTNLVRQHEVSKELNELENEMKGIEMMIEQLENNSK